MVGKEGGKAKVSKDQLLAVVLGHNTHPAALSQQATRPTLFCSTAHHVQVFLRSSLPACKRLAAHSRVVGLR